MAIQGLPSASGVDTAAIIQSILSAKQRPIENIQNQISKVEEKKRGYLDINSRLLAMQEVARRLYDGTSFNASVVKSSKADSLLATGNSSSYEGTFQFYTNSLASSAQYVSSGFTNPNGEKLTTSAGTVRIEVGNARVSRPTDLQALNGNTGIDRGKIRITDDVGNVSLVDLTNVITIDDVIDAINNNGKVQVIARINDMPGTGILGDGIILENASGAGTLKVENVGLGATATSLGIAGTSATGSLVGTRINSLGRGTALSLLNDGRGVGNGTGTLGTLVITGSGAAMNIDLTGVSTVGGVIDAINDVGGTVTASISSDGHSLVLSDAGAPASISVSGAVGVVSGFGLESATLLDMGGGDFQGTRLIASMNSVLMSSLGGNSGSGFAGTPTAPTSFDITDSMGSTTTVTFSGREDLAEIVNQINAPAGPGANVRAQVSTAGTGIEIVDMAGGVGTLTITDVTGTTAEEMGIAGTHSDGVAAAGNLNFKYMHANRNLTDFGFSGSLVEGKIAVTLMDGTQWTIDVSPSQTLGELVNELNSLPKLNVAINNTGDGLLFTDTSGGTGSLVMRDISGSIARNLNFSGTFGDGPTFDRRGEYEIEVDDNDNLNDLVDKIKGLNIPVVTTTFDDGTGARPYRLAITAKSPGMLNDIIVESNLASLQFNQTSTASDAVVLYGNSSGTADPVVLRSNNNTFKKVLSGITLDLLQLSEAPITVSITRDLQAAANDISELVDTYNSFSDRLDELAGYNAETETPGPLMGDSALSGLDFGISRALIDAVSGLSLGANTISMLGIEIESSGHLSSDSEKLLEALESRLDDVKALFANTAKLTPDTLFANWNSGEGLKSVDGDDLRISFSDGSADLAIDLSNYEKLGQLITALNADGRVLAEISADSTRLVLHDLTNGAGDFTINDANDSGTSASLGLTRTVSLPGDYRLETRSIMLDTELGVARKLDNAVKSFTESGGLIEDATAALDEKVKKYNEDIEKINERIDSERDRLERQFAAMESALRESQQTATALNQALNNSNKSDKK